MSRNPLFLLYLLLIHLLLGVMLIKSDFLPRVLQKIDYAKYAPEYSRHYKEMIQYHQYRDKQVTKGSVIFIGDSITEGLAVNAVAPNAVNYGIGADTTLGVLGRIKYYDSLNSAHAIVLAIGVNDLERRNNKEIIENFNKIFNKFPNDIPILVSSILPIDEKIIQIGRNINKRINRLNKKIKVLCDHKKSLTFLDSTQKFIDTKGNLLNSYHIGDGIHLSSKAYKIWIEQLKTALQDIY